LHYASGFENKFQKASDYRWYVLMELEFRSDCPVTTALDILGDKWILVIVKQMLIEGMQTFKDFTESDEAIATNILTNKLKHLEALGLVTKTKLPTNKKTVYYHLTDKGLQLTPIIVEIALWSDENLREINTDMMDTEDLASMKTNKEAFIKEMVSRYQAMKAETLRV